MEFKDFKDFKSFSQEVILQCLALANEKVIKLKEIGDLSGYELLEKEYLPKYEKLYLAMESQEFKEVYGKEFINLKKTIQDIMEKNNFSKEFIQDKISIRNSLGEDGGSIVVKRFYEYELKEVKSKKQELLKEADLVLDEEFKVNNELSNSVQQEEQMEIIYKLHPLREKFRNLDKEIMRLGKLEAELEDKLKTKWRYEIYGTINQKKLKEIFGKEENEKND
ncbi:MAG: hypothetical protein ACRC6U_05255 [Fusobacteriaceae bacterium]